jgi:hypothetical protein
MITLLSRWASQAREFHIERAQADPHGEMGRLTIITALNGL